MTHHLDRLVMGYRRELIDDNQWNEKRCPLTEFDRIPGIHSSISQQQQQQQSVSKEESAEQEGNGSDPDDNSSVPISEAIEQAQAALQNTESQRNDFSQANNVGRSPHHFDPVGRERQRGLGSAVRNAPTRVFRETQGHFFRGSIQQDSSHPGISPPLLRRIQAIDEGQGISTSRSVSSSGISWLPIIISVLAVVFVWLFVLAAFWHFGGCHHCIKRERKSFRDENDETTTKSVPQQQNSSLRVNVNEDDEENPDEEDVIVMECASAASPRWLSFPKAHALQKVASFFTNTSLASLASSASVQPPPPPEEDGKPSEAGPDVTLNTTASSGGGSQFFKLGIVKDGKVDISSDSLPAITDIATTSTAAGSEKGGSTTHHSRFTTGATTVHSSSQPPWNEILGDLYTDFVTCDVDDFNNVSFGHSSFFSGYLSAISRASTTTNGGENGKSFGDTTTIATTSVDAPPHPPSTTTSISVRANEATTTDAAATAANQDEILRDLEELEHQVNHHHSDEESIRELWDLQKLELETRIASGSLNNSRVTEEDGPEHPAEMDAEKLSKLLTTVLHQTNQQSLLDQDGAQIWYNAQTKSFFRNEHERVSSNCSSSKGDSSNEIVAAEPLSLSTSDELGTARSRSDLKKMSRTCKPWGNAIRGYRSLTSPGADPIGEKRDVSDRSSSEESGDSRPQLLLDSHPFAKFIFWVAGLGIIASSLSMAIFGANALQESSMLSSGVFRDAEEMPLDGTRMVDEFLGSSPFLVELTESSSTNNIANTSRDGDRLYNTFENLTKRLFRSTNAACDFGSVNSSNLGEALNDLVGLWNDNMTMSSPIDEDNTGSGMVLQRLGSIPDDLARAINTTATSIGLGKSMIGSLNWIVPLVRVSNILQGILCLLILAGVLVTNNRLLRSLNRWCIIPLYGALVVLSIIGFIFFLGESLAVAEFCTNPDDQVLELLFTKENDLEFLSSSRSLDIARGYIQKCPSDAGEMMVPRGEAKMLVDSGWKFARALWEVSRILVDAKTCPFSMADETILYGGSISKMGEALVHASCDFSVLLEEYTDMLRCDNWYRLYEEGMNNAVCQAGRSGFLWGAITQSIIVLLSMTILTVYIVCFAHGSQNNSISPEILDTTAGNHANVAGHKRDSTMLIEEEEDEEKDRKHSNAHNDGDRLQALTTSPNFSFESEDFDDHGQTAGNFAELNRLAFDRGDLALFTKSHFSKDNKKASQSCTKRIRKNCHRPKQSNHVASTSLYTIGAFQSFETEDDIDDGENDPYAVEVYLNNKQPSSKILSRFEEEEGKRFFDNWTWKRPHGKIGGLRDPVDQEEEESPVVTSARYSPSIVMGHIVSSDKISCEVDRVRGRLKDIQEQRGEKTAFTKEVPRATSNISTSQEEMDQYFTYGASEYQ